MGWGIFNRPFGDYCTGADTYLVVRSKRFLGHVARIYRSPDRMLPFTYFRWLTASMEVVPATSSPWWNPSEFVESNFVCSNVVIAPDRCPEAFMALRRNLMKCAPKMISA